MTRRERDGIGVIKLNEDQIEKLKELYDEHTKAKSTIMDEKEWLLHVLKMYVEQRNKKSNKKTISMILKAKASFINYDLWHLVDEETLKHELK